MLNSNIKKHLDSERANLLVIGHPGTGKTYNLLSSIEYLVEKKDIPPSRILVFCFNRRWSKIIREESAHRLNSSFAELPVETFFSFSKDILSYSRISKRERPFTIDVLDSTQQWEILTDIIAGLDERDYPVSKRITLRGKHALAGFTQEVFDFILRAQENLIEPKTLSNKFTPYFDKTLSEITGIYSRYLKRLRSINKYNYGRILTGASRVLQEDKAIRDYFQDSYDFIMVDELHEVNTAQLSILNSLAKDNVLMFGNDDESIFSFRGSMIDNLKKIYDSLDRDKIIFLDKDYRSHSAISML